MTMKNINYAKRRYRTLPMNTMRDRLATAVVVTFVLTIVIDLAVSAAGALTGHDVASFRGEAQRILTAEVQLLLLAVGYYFGRSGSAATPEKPALPELPATPEKPALTHEA